MQPRFSVIVFCEAGAGGNPPTRDIIESSIKQFEGVTLAERWLAGAVPPTLPEGWRAVAEHEATAREALRHAMQKLALVDGFFLAPFDAPSVERGILDAMIARYLDVRRKLGRIVVIERDGRQGWPWLVDIGFRQPFIELADGQPLEAVLAANAAQVHSVKG